MIQKKTSFEPDSVKDVEKIIKNIPINKDTEGDIPIQILKQGWFTFITLTDCTNDPINKSVFLGSLKIANECIAFIILQPL